MQQSDIQENIYFLTRWHCQDLTDFFPLQYNLFFNQVTVNIMLTMSGPEIAWMKDVK